MRSAKLAAAAIAVAALRPGEALKVARGHTPAHEHLGEVTVACEVSVHLVVPTRDQISLGFQVAARPAVRTDALHVVLLLRHCGNGISVNSTAFSLTKKFIKT